MTFGLSGMRPAKHGHENDLAKFGFFGQMRFWPNAVWPNAGMTADSCLKFCLLISCYYFFICFFSLSLCLCLTIHSLHIRRDIDSDDSHTSSCAQRIVVNESCAWDTEEILLSLFHLLGRRNEFGNSLLVVNSIVADCPLVAGRDTKSQSVLCP